MNGDPTYQAHLPAIGTHERSTVGSDLQDTLVELVDLTLLGKQLHWCVVGPLFRSVHLYLDEAIDVWRDAADTVAERAVSIGFWPEGQAAAVAAATGRQAVPPGPIEDQTVLQKLAGTLAAVSEEIRTRTARVGALDPVSEDVLIEVTRTIEEQLWTTRAHFAPTTTRPEREPDAAEARQAAMATAGKA
jgi:starvation-inducible DNA-binding protein